MSLAESSRPPAELADAPAADGVAPPATAEAVRYQAFVDRYPTLLDDNLNAGLASRLPEFMASFDWVVGLPHCQDPLLAPMFFSEIPNCVPFPRAHTPRIDPGADPYAKGLANPGSVMVDALRLGDLLDYAEAHFDPPHAGRFLYIVSDLNMTYLSGVFGLTPDQFGARLGQRFSAVWLYANDVRVPGVHTMPLGLRDMYLRGAADGAETAIAGASLSRTSKRRNVLGAWGAFYAGLEREDCGQAPAESRFACESRSAARRWGGSDAAAQAGVEVVQLPPEQYWSEVARSRFLVSPLGQGIQSSKVTEALLVLTVPIVERGARPGFPGFVAHDDLVALGFPIVVVDDWSEINATSLDHWWEALSPRLESFRENCLSTAAFREILSGARRHCA